jgi:hypothetical protein
MSPDLVTNSNGTYKNGTGTIEGWSSSEMCSFLNNTVFYSIPTIVRNQILPVKKWCKKYYSDGTSGTSRLSGGYKLWIPSRRELGDSSSIAENSGPVYSELFVNNESRAKECSSSYYWTRTAYNITQYCLMSKTGEIKYIATPNSNYGVVLCFCT